MEGVEANVLRKGGREMYLREWWSGESAASELDCEGDSGAMSSPLSNQEIQDAQPGKVAVSF